MKLKAFTEIIQPCSAEELSDPPPAPTTIGVVVPTVPKNNGTDMWRLVNDLSGLNQVMHPLKIDPSYGRHFLALQALARHGRIFLADEGRRRPVRISGTPMDRYEFCRAPMGMQSSSSWMGATCADIIGLRYGVRGALYRRHLVLWRGRYRPFRSPAELLATSTLLKRY